MSFVAVAVTGAVVTGASQIKAGRDAKDAYRKSAASAQAEAKHRREIAQYNAKILTEQAARLRGEQVNRINEVVNINLGRLAETLDTNIGRENESLDINTGRLLESARTNVGRIQEAAGTNIGRIEEVANTNIGRLSKKAQQTVEQGAEVEDDVRRVAAEVISSQRAFYGAGNVVIDSGTPAALQVGTARMGEVDALRVRRNYRLQADALLEQASDIKRDSSYMIEDIMKSTSYQVGDISRTTGYQVADNVRNTMYSIQDQAGDYANQRADLLRNQGYDLSDTEFDALKLDQEAVLTILNGDAELVAGQNRADAYNTAGSNAMTSGILNGLGTIAGSVDPKWFTKDSAFVGPLQRNGTQ